MSVFYSIAEVVFKQNTKKEKHILIEIKEILTEYETSYWKKKILKKHQQLHILFLYEWGKKQQESQVHKL